MADLSKVTSHGQNICKIYQFSGSQIVPDNFLARSVVCIMGFIQAPLSVTKYSTTCCTNEGICYVCSVEFCPLAARNPPFLS